MGAGGELERTLVDLYGTGVTVRSCCEKRFEKKQTLKKSLKFSMDSRRDQSLDQGLGTSLALQCSAGLVGSGFPCKVA